MVESVVIGLLGGLIGSSLGVLAVVVLSLSQQWTPMLDPLMAIGAALLGAVVGLAAGGLPARRAARIEPITARGLTALRGSVGRFDIGRPAARLRGSSAPVARIEQAE